MNVKGRILVVDNDELNLKTIINLLQNDGYDTSQVRTGKGTLKVLGEFQPDLVLLDVNLPDQNGVEVCRLIKSGTGDIPHVILISSNATDSDRQAEGLEYGADGYLTRPISNRELLARVSATLRLRRAEQALRVSETRYRTIFDAAPVSIWVEDFSQVYDLLENLRKTGVKDLKQYLADHPDFGMNAARTVFVRDVNETTLKVFKAKTKKPFLTSIDVCIPKEMKNPLEDELLAIWNREPVLEVERINLTPGGEEIYLNMMIRFPETRDEFSRVWVTKTDITERKRAEKALRHSHDLLGYIIEHNKGSVAVLDSDLRYVFVSQRFLEDYKIKEKNIIGKKHYEVLPDLPKKWKAIHQRTLQGETLSAEDDLYEREDGTVDWTRWECRPWYELDGSIGGIVLYTEIINERKKQEESLLHSNKRISHANKLLLALSQAAQAVLRARTQKEVYQAVQGQMNQLGYSISISELDPETKKLHFTFINYDSKLVRSAEKMTGLSMTNFYFDPPQGSIYQRILTQGITVYVEDATQAVEETLPKGLRALSRPVAELLHLKAAISTPLIVDGETLGIMTFNGNDLSEDDIPAITAFGSQAAIAIQNARLSERNQIEISERKQAEVALAESEELYRQVFESANVGKSLTAPGGKIFVNQAFADMLGYSKEELAHRTWQSLTPAEEVEPIQLLIDPLLKGEKDSARLTKRYIHKNGSHVWGDVSTTIRRDREGKPLHFITTVVDITELKQAENALRETNALLSSFIQNSPIYAFIKEVTPTQSRVLKASENYQEMIGIPGSQMVGKTMEELFPAELAAQFTADDWSVVNRGEVLHLEEEMNDRQYTTFKFPIRLGERTLLAGYTIDITERKQASEALRLLSLRQETILAAIPDILMEVDMNKVYTWANPVGMQFFGPDVIGRQAQEYFLGEQQVYATVKPLFEGDENTIYVESWQRRQDGEKRLLGWWCKVRRDDKGEVIGALSTARDITELKQAEDALRESERRLMTLMGNLPGLAYRCHNDENWTMEFVSDGCAGLTGYPARDLIGDKIVTFSQLIHPDDRQMVRDSIQSSLDKKQAFQLTYRITTAEGQEKWVMERGQGVFAPDGNFDALEGFVMDITERILAQQALQDYNTRLEADVNERTRELHETQEQLVRKEKLAVLGQMAGGVGHELRNPLGVISNAVYFLRLIQPGAEGKVKEYVDMIEKETRNAEKIITDLLEFARTKSIAKESISVIELVTSTLARHPAPDSISLVMEFSPVLPNVYVDPRQIEQILENLVVNAYQAMPEGGTLNLQAKTESMDDREFVAVSIRDSGTGISEANMAKVFEPLFTTKPRGIGLGLTVCRKLIEANGGWIDVQSEEGKGAVFSVHLPVEGFNHA